MSPLLTSTAVAILWVHGLIHLMGAVVYMRLGSIEGLPYKTVLAGRWDVGGAGAAAFGLLWAVAAGRLRRGRRRPRRRRRLVAADDARYGGPLAGHRPD